MQRVSHLERKNVIILRFFRTCKRSEFSIFCFTESIHLRNLMYVNCDSIDTIYEQNAQQNPNASQKSLLTFMSFIGKSNFMT